ncbi:MAG: hypothetical protein CMB64_03430 [Euryarchaeota archaeon]|nr:hypothetical protein [Euryarchaeota archaeon]
MSEDLGQMIKGFLDQHGQENQMMSEMKEVRKSKKEYCETVMRLMKEKDLLVVRVMTHKDGPKDIILKKRIKKATITSKMIQKALGEYHGEILQQKLIDDIMQKLQNSADSVETFSLQIKKLKVDNSEPTVLGE